MTNPTFAILDLGTNTFHLLIFTADAKGGWNKILHRRITVKLGQGGIHKNEIAAVPYRRGLKALEKFREYMYKYDIKRVQTFGTAALRHAANGKQFIKDAERLHRISIKLISGDQEAGYILQGVRQAVDMTLCKSLIMDIGGGSVEFIIANHNNIYYKQSFKLGAALLLEQFHPSEPVKRNEVEAFHQHFDSVLKPLFSAIQKHKPEMLIGSAGSFESFASMISHLFPESGSHYGKKSHIIKLKHYNALHKLILSSTRTERKQMPGLIKMRVDMIVMAAVLFNYVLRKSGIKEIRMSAYSLKEGAVWEMINDR
jgi:exopolyphosphatase/guanosine-5'-triphosphate,3'-diphosphate pyrophosphatase